MSKSSSPLTSSRLSSKQSGFTLAEVVLAVGLISLFLLAIIGLLGPANKSVLRVLALDKLSRTYPVIDGYFSQGAAGEHEAVRFARLFNMVKQAPAAGDAVSAGQSDLLIAFSYRATIPSAGAAVSMDAIHGLPAPFPPPATTIPRQGIDYFIYDAVMSLDDFIDFFPTESERPGFLEGDSFVIALVESDVNPAPDPLTTYVIENPDTDSDGQPDITNAGYKDKDTYPEAVVVADMQFYLVDDVSNAGLLRAIGTQGATPADPDNPKEPLMTLSMGFNR